MPAATDFDRRRLLQFGALAAGAATIAGCASSPGSAKQVSKPLAKDRLAAIIGAEAEVDGPVVSIGVGRNDIEKAMVPYSLNGSRLEVPFNPGFELGGEFTFQALDGGAQMNGDFPFLAEEVQPALDAMRRAGLVTQSLHQHYMQLEPMVYFMHFRAFGDAEEIARGIRSVIDTTGAKLPQKSPKEPSTPLDKDMIGRVLRDDKPSVSEDGAVTVVVPRIDGVKLGGRAVDPGLNVSSNVAFQKLPGGQTAAAPDFAMTTEEVGPVLDKMRGAGWDLHCLYNQETGEQPQLFFSHMLKVGDTASLAREIRAGLDLTASKRA